MAWSGNGRRLAWLFWVLGGASPLSAQLPSFLSSDRVQEIQALVASRWATAADSVVLLSADGPPHPFWATHAPLRLAGSGRTGQFVILPQAHPGSGYASLRIRAMHRARVPVAAVPLSRGDTVSTERVRYESRLLSAHAPRPLEEDVSWIASRPLRAGDLLTDRSLRRAPDAPAGSEVWVRSGSSGVAVQVRGRLLQEGMVGHLVLVQVVGGRGRVRATMISPTEVHLPH